MVILHQLGLVHGSATNTDLRLAALDDPRIERTKLHPLLSILTIARCAVICGAESCDAIADFGEAKSEWPRTFLDLPHGIPSPDTFKGGR